MISEMAGTTDIPSEPHYFCGLYLSLGTRLADATPSAVFCPSEESLKWLIQTPEYVEWISRDESSQIWLHGPPGDGKTVAVAYVLENLLQKL